MKKIIYFIAPALLLFLVSFKNHPQKPKPKLKAKTVAIFGIDISECQPGSINWKKVKTSRYKVKFVIMRKTMGDDRDDEKFDKRFQEAKSAGFKVGTYHYYDPNENSTKQAHNYLSAIKLRKGDLIPIVDLERLSRIQSTEKLKMGLKNFLDIVEKHYGVKPMLYTSYSFFVDNLSEEFSNYPLWIACYSSKIMGKNALKNCRIHQYVKKFPVQGIRGKVDGNETTTVNLKKVTL